MAEFGGILIFILAIFGLLQIILFFKIWEMTNDTKKTANNINMLTKHLCRAEYVKLNGCTLESKGITCDIDGFKIVFSDGVSGEFKDSDKCSFVIDNNIELKYENQGYTCDAMHEYLTTKIQIQKGLSKDTL